MFALTAYAAAGDEKAFLAAGFDGYIAKNGDAGPILEAVNRASSPLAGTQAMLAGTQAPLAGKGGASAADASGSASMPETLRATMDDILESIIEEGGAGFRAALAAALAAEPRPTAKLGLIVNRFLPEIFSDVDLISILLTEASDVSGLGEKLLYLARLIGDAVRGAQDAARGERRAAGGIELGEGDMVAGLLVFFLGALDSVRLMRAAKLPVAEADILGFIRKVISNAYGVDAEGLAP